jgi:hypothetical protein
MKPVNHQKTPTTIGETPSNNENNKKQTTTIQADKRKVYVLKAGIPKRKSQFSKLSPASVQF